MNELLDRRCALCVNVQTNGAHRQCVGDLRAMTKTVHSVPIIDGLYSAGADRRVLLDWLGTHFMSGASLTTFLPGSKALCARTSCGSL